MASITFRTKPLKEFEAINPGHLQVEQDHVGHGIFKTVAVITASFQVINRFATIFDCDQTNWQRSAFELHSDHQNVIRIIFDQ